MQNTQSANEQVNAKVSSKKYLEETSCMLTMLFKSVCTTVARRSVSTTQYQNTVHS